MKHETLEKTEYHSKVNNILGRLYVKWKKVGPERFQCRKAKEEKTSYEWSLWTKYWEGKCWHLREEWTNSWHTDKKTGNNKNTKKKKKEREKTNKRDHFKGFGV